MFKPNTHFTKKITILGLCCFLLAGFFAFLLLHSNPAAAQCPDCTAAIGALTAVEASKGAVDVGENTRRTLRDVLADLWEDLKAIFYKNVLGSFANLMAQQTAVWVASGGEGETPQFITNLSGYLKDYQNKMMGDMAQTIIRDLTGIDICTMDPRISIDIALDLPVFPDQTFDYSPSCTWTQLVSHWEEIGKGQFLTFNATLQQGGEFSENVKSINQFLQADKRLQYWPLELGTTVETLNTGQCSPEGTLFKCNPPIQEAIKQSGTLLDQYTDALSSDVNLMLSYALSDADAPLSIGKIKVNEENIPEIQKKWLAKLKVETDAIKKTSDGYTKCVGKSAVELAARPDDCQSVMNDLSVVAAPRGTNAGKLLSDEDITHVDTIFISNWQEKTKHVVQVQNALNTGFQFLTSQVQEKFTPEYFQDSAAYDINLAKELFSHEGNEFNAYDTMFQRLSEEGLDAMIGGNIETTVNQGWKAVTDKIGDTIRTPSNLIRKKAEDDIIGGKKTYQYYTKSIAADALGVFLETLWNELVKRLLENLAGGATTESNVSLSQKGADTSALGDLSVPVLNIFNPYEEQIVTKEGVTDYIEKLARQFSLRYTYKDIDLLQEFQLTVKGEINPNLYNNVIDANFAIAVNDKLTIAKAISESKLLGNYKFSWGEQPQAGTYNLANIKKLRKARIVPLGLELAAEMIRDCNYRVEIGFGDFQDLCTSGTNCSRYGYDNWQTEPYKTQRLRNCVFKPLPANLDAVNVDEIQTFNKAKLALVTDATLADVVNGFSQAGSGTCGDFDDQESPFCNLVDPTWVLKLPATKCALPTDQEAYNELMVTNANGQRYASCPDFASCLKEDSKGSCLNEEYGYCVKEKNSWQFNADTCPAEYDSCRTYTVTDNAGTRLVSYLQNTLSGNDICGASNAGCNWYATKTVNAMWEDFASFDLTKCTDPEVGGKWINGVGCQAERIYLNRYAETCDRTKDGCNEFSVYRNSNNNLVLDSGFEYTPVDNFPSNWDLKSKKLVANVAACPAGQYSEICYNYNYNNENECLANNGTWQGFCSDNVSYSEAECLANNNTWNYNCLGAFNSNVTEAECSGSATFRRYCTQSVLKYNLCLNPQFTGTEAQTLCQANGGSWVEECQIDGVMVAELSDNMANCQLPENKGSWVTYCQGAALYGSDDIQNPQTKAQCASRLGSWRGYGPFSDLSAVTNEGVNNYEGLSRLNVNIPSSLQDGEELQLIYKSHYGDTNQVLTKAGDIYTASGYVSSNTALVNPVTLSLVKTYLNGDVEMNSAKYYINEVYQQLNSSLFALNPGTELQIIVSIPGGNPGNQVFLDAFDLSINTIDQLKNYNLVSEYRGYESNEKNYYKKPPARLNCHGYSKGDPAPKLEVSPLSEGNCIGNKGYWDAKLVYKDTPDCYRYAPDSELCANYMKICQPDEAGCQLYTPTNGDPSIPGVVSALDYCPAECLNYGSYKQEPALYDPEPEPLFSYFIPNTATSCSYAEVGCSQFTNLDELAKGGEAIGYYTYLRQCIKPGLGLGEKTFFTWRGSAGGPPQLQKFEFQQAADGAPKTINSEGDCRQTIGESDLNCQKFFDNNNNEYYRDLTKLISVSDDCHPFRKTEATETNCLATNGRWQNSECIYDAIPSEAINCSAQSNGCRAYVGNQGNNIYINSLDNFEGSALDWFSGEAGNEIGLTMVGESVVAGGHSLFVPEDINTINKPIEITTGRLYNLSFWAKAEEENEAISIKFNTAVDDGKADTKEEFAPESAQLKLSSQWQNYNLGPVYVSWNVAEGETNRLVFANIDKKIYLDNIILKTVEDNAYVVKNSWVTPTSCDRNIFGAVDPNNPHPMLGCQAYDDKSGQRHNLKSFTSLCRENVIGCEILINTQNSLNPNKYQVNDNNSTILDDYEVPADSLETYVLDTNYQCVSQDQGCQKLGKPSFEGSNLKGFEDVYIKNDPDKYQNIPNAIMCNDDSLGCTELINNVGSAEYYKILPTQLCYFGQNDVNGLSVKGWFKKGSTEIGCGALTDPSAAACASNGGAWSQKYKQCTIILNDIGDNISCEKKDGEWLNSNCLATPFSIYKVYEANKYKGYVGECSSKWNGCSRFVDVNPNFVANGSFEIVSQERATNWASVHSQSGSQKIETDNVQEGSKSLKVIKRTDANCPDTYLTTGCSAQPYGITQRLGSLEQGKTYKISFYYNVPAEAKGQGENCPLPAASVSISRYLDQSNLEEGDVYIYQPESTWKQADLLFTVPVNQALAQVQDYQLKLNAPLNGVCINNTTNEKKYTTSTGQLILNKAQCEVGGWTWQGNCTESYIIYDLVQVKDNTEDSYYVIDLGTNLDRKSCTNIDWNSGCVQFYNSFSKSYEIINVKKDRDCSEWAVCSSYCSDAVSGTKTECEAKGKIWNDNLCTATDLCQEQVSGQCTKLANKKDSVRYDLSSNPLILKRVNDFDNKEGYIYRFGNGAASDVTQWRAGDYSGYTLADRYPIEAELSKDFAIYPRESDLGDRAEARYADPICKVFPEKNSPWPNQLTVGHQQYLNVTNKFSPSASLKELGNMCSYWLVKAKNLSTYWYNDQNSIPTSICVSPETSKGAASNDSVFVCSGTNSTSDSTSEVEVSEQINGLEGMCLETDLLNPVYSDIYNSYYDYCTVAGATNESDCTALSGTWVAHSYQPYACLTYYPFNVDLQKYKQ